MKGRVKRLMIAHLLKARLNDRQPSSERLVKGQASSHGGDGKLLDLLFRAAGLRQLVDALCRNDGAVHVKAERFRCLQSAAVLGILCHVPAEAAQTERDMADNGENVERAKETRGKAIAGRPLSDG